MYSQPGLRTAGLERLCDMVSVIVNILSQANLDVVHGELKNTSKYFWDRKELISGVSGYGSFLSKSQ